MKHTFVLINNLRAVLVAALTSGIVGAVSAQQLYPVTPTSPLPESGRFGGTGPGGTPAGVPANDLRHAAPEERHRDGRMQQGGTPLGQISTDPRNAPVGQTGTQPSGSAPGQFSYDSRNMPRGRVETLSGTTGGQSPGDFRTAPSGQTGAYGGSTFGQVPGDAKRTLYGQPRTSGSKAASSGQKRQYGSATSGKGRPESKDASASQTPASGSATRKASSDSGDIYTDQSHGYGATTARQSPSAARDSTSGEGRESAPAAKGKASAEGREASRDERQTSAQGSAQGSPKRERPADSSGAPAVRSPGDASTPVKPGKKESPKDPYEGIKLN